MIRRPPEKTIALPSHLVDRLKAVAIRQGVSLSTYTEEILEQALKAGNMRTSLQEAVDTHRVIDVHKGSGYIHLSRSSLNQILGKLYATHREELQRIWFESGRWYGEYLRTKLKDGDILEFLEKSLQVAWNLDEVEIQENENTTLRFVSFAMSNEITNLLIDYITGVMDSLGYKGRGRDHLRGMATLKFSRKIRSQ